MKINVQASKHMVYIIINDIRPDNGYWLYGMFLTTVHFRRIFFAGFHLSAEILNVKYKLKFEKNIFVYRFSNLFLF